MKVQLWSEHRLRLNGTSFQKEFLQALIFFRCNSENDKKGRSNYHTDHQKIRKMNSIVNVNLRQQFTSV